MVQTNNNSMEKIVTWLNENLGDNIQITTPQFERTSKRKFEYVPVTEDQFKTVIENAPTDILRGMGFGKWSSMNSLINENNEAKPKHTISIPLLNPEDALDSFNPDAPKQEGKMRIENGSLKVECGKEEGTPTELLDEDEDVLLFPAEWYNIIPNGFIVTGLCGESYPFVKGKSDDDMRFGCLAYGIRRKSELLNV